MIEKLALIIGVSLAGSLHCAGMCGAFVAFAVGGAPNGDAAQEQPPRWLLNVSYHLGRLATYALLGAICGALGSVIDLGGSLVGFQQAAAIVAGGMIVAFGAAGVARALGWRFASLKAPGAVQRAVNGALRLAMKLRPAQRALVVGLLTTLLPCGWLWAFAAVAAGTADPLLGGVVMAAFWLGTVPILAGLGLGVGSLMRWAKPKLAMAMSVAIIAVGLYTIFHRAQMPAIAGPASIELDASTIPTTAPCCPTDDQ